MFDDVFTLTSDLKLFGIENESQYQSVSSRGSTTWTFVTPMSLRNKFFKGFGGLWEGYYSFYIKRAEDKFKYISSI
jgi:hypothetical protein